MLLHHFARSKVHRRQFSKVVRAVIEAGIQANGGGPTVLEEDIATPHLTPILNGVPGEPGRWRVAKHHGSQRIHRGHGMVKRPAYPQQILVSLSVKRCVR